MSAGGLKGLADAVFRRILYRQARSVGAHQPFFVGKKGLEIGGPSGIFAENGLFPIYSVVGDLDNCNFSPSTIWEGEIKPGQTFHYRSGQAAGWQYIQEAAELTGITDLSYDFVLSSHTLEHMANPLKALCEWKRVLKPGGLLVLVLPDKTNTFDHKRPITSLEHLIDDRKRGTTEADLTHLPEILALHDLERDREAGDFEAFKERSFHNFEHRCLHQHVFDAALTEAVLDYVGIRLRAIELFPPFHIFAIAEKP